MPLDRYIIEAVEDFTEGSSSNNLHAFSGASPAVQRQDPARGGAGSGAGAGAGAGAGGGRRTSGEERRDFRSHVVLGLRIGSQWESVYNPPPYVMRLCGWCSYAQLTRARGVLSVGSCQVFLRRPRWPEDCAGGPLFCAIKTQQGLPGQ